MYRAETLADIASAGPVIDVLIEFDAVTPDRPEQIMQTVSQRAAAADPRPIRLSARVDGQMPSHPRLVEQVCAVDDPHYLRA